MVLFINININQRVEVDYRGEIATGKVKYKGTLNGICGDWVGVDLDRPIGRHDGMLNGRRYFFSRPNHGLFTTADRIRFVPIKRNSFDGYRPVSRRSDVDEHLFTSYSQQVIDQERDPRDCMGWIEEAYLERASNDFRRDRRRSSEPRFHLNHSVSNHIPAQTMLRPQTSKARFITSSSPTPYYSLNFEDLDYEPFTSTPSIPKTHMPRETLVRQIERGWDNDHYVREMSVHTGRDSLKFSQWNDIS